jgi:predicted HTH transcriptional regulator
MYDDRIDIYSPGGMVDGSLIQERDIEEVPSLRRNPTIADMFQRLDCAERQGSGIRRIREETSYLYGYTDEYAPMFKSAPSEFHVILKNMNYDLYSTSGQVSDQEGDQVSDQVSDQEGDQVGGQVGGQVSDQVSDQEGGQVGGQEGGQEGGQVSGQVGGQVNLQTSDYNYRMETLLEFCKTARTRKEMQEFVGISSRDFFRINYLNPLLNAGKLQMTIPDNPNNRNQKYIQARN